MMYYKGFDKNMQCRGFQYEEGKTYHEEKAELCKRGFHACEEPIEVLKYYAPGHGSIYREVELDEISEVRDNDSKVCAKTIKIGAKIGIPELVLAQIEHVEAHTTTKHIDPHMATAGESGVATAGNYGASIAGNGGVATAGNYGAATAGESGVATAGNYGAATAGYCGAATAGESGVATAGNGGVAIAGHRGAATAGESGVATAGNGGVATAGYCGTATAGNYGAATAGNGGVAIAGHRGAATAGYCGTATAGNYGAATSRWKSKTGADGVCVARGYGAMVCGGLASVLVLVEDDDYNGIRWWKAVAVDGEIVKADTWYRLEDGELVEVKRESSGSL